MLYVHKCSLLLHTCISKWLDGVLDYDVIFFGGGGGGVKESFNTFNSYTCALLHSHKLIWGMSENLLIL